MGGWCCGLCHGRILLRIEQLPVLSPAINAVYGKSGPVIRRPRFYFTNKTAGDWAATLTSGAPKIFKSLLAQFRVARCVLDRAMAEPVLNCPCVVACIGQCVAARMP